MTRNPPRVGIARKTYRFPRTLVAWNRALSITERVLGPAAELLVRLLLAQGFLVSGLLKAADWNTALTLATQEYPVSWLSPATAAALGIGVEVIGGLLLAVGLATRAAALALGALTIVVQSSYLALDSQLLSVALFGWIAVCGAGPLSLDALVGRGLARSALPFGASMVAACGWITHRVAPVYVLVLRLWLAAALVLGALGAAMSSVLPVTSAVALPGPIALMCAVLLAPGLAVRVVGAVLAGAALVTMASEAQVAALAVWSALGLLLALRGGGPLSLDETVRRALARRYPELEGRLGFDVAAAPRVVVVGAGFGGLACAAQLKHAPVKVTVIDRHNYHLFQPLLYQVATTALAPGDIATPIRGLLREQPNANVVFGEVTGVDMAARQVLMGERRIGYDYLVLATGARHSYFGRDEWEPYAPGLKRIEDATEVRRRLLVAFEQAENADDAAERDALLTFVIVGGGPTGVELAGAIAEIARYGMAKEFRNIDPARARVLLVQAGPRILPTFPEALSMRATESLRRLGVEVMVDSRVVAVDAGGVQIGEQRIAARTVLWAAGVGASPAATWLGAEAERDGRIKVLPDLTVPNHPDIFAIGDTAAARVWQGNYAPGLAHAAKQAGKYVGDVIAARVRGDNASRPFVYRHLGSLATIGRKAAVADFGGVKLWGAVAWWFWGFVHVGFLSGFRSRVSVMLDWFWSYLTFQGGTRLITGSSHADRVHE